MSRRTIFVISGVALLAIAIAYWFLLFSPLQKRISEQDSQIENSRQKLMVLQTKLAQLGAMKEEAAQNEGRLLELAKLVPESQQLPSLILEIQQLATEAGISFMTIAPGEPASNTGYQEIPLQLQFVGSFFDVNDFIYRAEQLAAAPGRLLTVQNLNLALAASASSGSSGGQTVQAGISPKLTVNMTLLAFERDPSLEPAPQATPPTTAATKKQ